MSDLSDSPHIIGLNVMSITKIYFDLSLMSELRLDKCQTPLIVLRHRKLIKVINKKGVQMNSIHENRNSLGSAFALTACDTCGGLTAWTRCVMCGGQFDTHCPQGKYYTKP